MRDCLQITGRVDDDDVSSRTARFSGRIYALRVTCACGPRERDGKVRVLVADTDRRDPGPSRGAGNEVEAATV